MLQFIRYTKFFSLEMTPCNLVAINLLPITRKIISVKNKLRETTKKEKEQKNEVRFSIVRF